MKKLIIVAMFLAANAVAEPRLVDSDHDDFVHATAHVGMSGLINLFMYGWYKKVFRMERKPALVFSAIITLTIGLTYKALEAHPTGVGKSMIQNVIGVGVSTIPVIMFDF